jgi:hypothetical protein
MRLCRILKFLKNCFYRFFTIIYFAKQNTVKTKTESLFRFGGVLGGPLQLLAGLDVVLLSELQIPQELESIPLTLILILEEGFMVGFLYHLWVWL